jgi:hypothetical protein
MGANPLGLKKKASAPAHRELRWLLLDPLVSKAIKAARAGVRFRRPVSALKIRWESAILSQLVRWLRAGAPLDMLAELLTAQPSLIWHPLVYFQLIRLRTFPSTEDESFKAHLASNEDGYDGGFSAAQQELRRLIAAWVQGMAGTGWDLKPPGWLLKPPPERPGRKRTMEDEDWYTELLRRYEDVLKELKKESIRRLSGESVSDWIQRLQGIIWRVWKDSDVGVEWKAGPLPRGQQPDSLKIPIVRTFIPLPQSHVQTWAQEAQQRAAEGPIRDQLAYKMVAYRWDLTPNQVRAAVQTARKAYKK